jgi:hypothetical protein
VIKRETELDLSTNALNPACLMLPRRSTCEEGRKPLNANDAVIASAVRRSDIVPFGRTVKGGPSKSAHKLIHRNMRSVRASSRRTVRMA